MKRHIYIVIVLISVATVLFGSCSSELLEDLPTPGNSVTGEDDGMVDVTIDFNVEDLANRATRADGATRSETAIDLSKIDLLVYALRDSSDNILYQYGKGIVDSAALYKCPALENYISNDDNNQTLLKIEWKKNEDTGKYEMEGENVKDGKITLRVMRGMVFKLSCWTQSSQCKAYDFNNLTDVKVDYSKMAINDESYDAFCATSIFSVGQVDAGITVTLTRPFAQINVRVKEDATSNDYSDYSHSKITLGGVHTSFNVVENKVNNKTEEVRFGYSPLPTGLDDNPDPGENAYKSLAMCYVLVPETSYEYGEDGKIEDDATAGDKSDTEGGAVSPSINEPKLNFISFSLAKDEDGTDSITYKPEKAKAEISVKRNWRTNLLFENLDWTKEEDE